MVYGQLLCFRCSQLQWFTDSYFVLGAAIRTSALLQIQSVTLTDNILQKTARQSVINVLNAELCPKRRCGWGKREPIPKLRSIIIMYIYHALINALNAHMIHINLNMTFYAHVEHSPTKTIYIK